MGQGPDCPAPLRWIEARPRVRTKGDWLQGRQARCPSPFVLPEKPAVPYGIGCERSREFKTPAQRGAHSPFNRCRWGDHRKSIVRVRFAVGPVVAGHSESLRPIGPQIADPTGACHDCLYEPIADKLIPALYAERSNHETGCRTRAGVFCRSCVFQVALTLADFGVLARMRLASWTLISVGSPSTGDRMPGALVNLRHQIRVIPHKAEPGAFVFHSKSRDSPSWMASRSVVRAVCESFSAP
jgi:hypothetical protein